MTALQQPREQAVQIRAGGQRLEGERLQKIIKKGLIIIGYI